MYLIGSKFEIQNCPYCGSSARLTPHFSRWRVFCKRQAGCGVSGPISKYKPSAITRWNKVQSKSSRLEDQARINEINIAKWIEKNEPSLVEESAKTRQETTIQDFIYWYAYMKPTRREDDGGRDKTNGIHMRALILFKNLDDKFKEDFFKLPADYISSKQFEKTVMSQKNTGVKTLSYIKSQYEKFQERMQ